MMNGVTQESIRSKEEKRAFWRRHQLAWEASGLSRTAYCQRENLKLSSFDYQRACLRARDAHDTNAVHHEINAEQHQVRPTANVTHSTNVAPNKMNRFVTAIRTQKPVTNEHLPFISDASDQLRLHSPDGWQIHFTEKHVLHQAPIIRTLLQLLGYSP